MLRVEGTEKRGQVTHLGLGLWIEVTMVGRVRWGWPEGMKRDAEIGAEGIDSSCTGELGYHLSLAERFGAPACLPPLQAPRAAPGEVCAKLELFLWLGLGKQTKACTSELPQDLLPEPSAGLPHSLYRDGEFGTRVNPPCCLP